MPTCGQQLGRCAHFNNAPFIKHQNQDGLHIRGQMRQEITQALPVIEGGAELLEMGEECTAQLEDDALSYLSHLRWQWLVTAVGAEVLALIAFGALQRELLKAGGVRMGLQTATIIA